MSRAPNAQKQSLPASSIPPRIFLVGFMGSGKTTIGRLLARRLGRPFIDLDERIVERTGRSISRLFAERGEAAFRQLETELIGEVIDEPEAVISLGGGAFVSEVNRRMIQASGVSIWLDCAFEIIVKRLEGTNDRPLNTSPEQLRRLLESRLSSYAQADLRIDASRSQPAELVEEIIGRLRDRSTRRSSST